MIPVAVNEHDAVVHEGRGFVRTVWQRPAPRGTKLAHVGAIDLLERAEAECIVGAPPRQPLALRRPGQHRVGDGSKTIERIRSSRSRRERHPWRQSTAGHPRPIGRSNPLECLGLRRHVAWARRRTVFLEDERKNPGVGLVAERSRTCGRHLRARVAEQSLSRQLSPLLPEVHALERRRKRAVVHVLAMTRRAMFHVR